LCCIPTIRGLAAVSAENQRRLARAASSLEGLSVGDAFGERYFGRREVVEQHIRERILPDPPWEWTDDTAMALSIYEVLAACGEIDQDRLAESFAAHHEHGRGYGSGTARLLLNIAAGQNWRSAAADQFGGSGSFGNGAAMRVAPVGAYFASDMKRVVEQAVRSAEITHSHPEGIAGAIAIAVGAAIAWRARRRKRRPGRKAFLSMVVRHIPDSEVRRGIERARDLPPRTPVAEAVRVLGNGSRVSAQDTVPFALWCAGMRLGNYEEALWLTVSGLGDRDTTCAMVGGIVAGYTGADRIPVAWLAYREPLPEWPFRHE